MKRQLLHLIFLLLTVFAAQAQELYVGTYNVRYKNSGDNNAGNGWATRYTQLINFVNFQQPDLLGVQEAVRAQMNDMASGLKGYAYIGVGRDDGNTGGEYSAIFYRTERMIPLDHGDFWLSDTAYTPSKGFPSKGGSTTYKRICTWGKFFDKATGTVIYHFNTHLDLDETNRQQSYYLIKQKIEELAGSNFRNVPIIISGDYNAVQTGDAYKLFSGSGFLFDCYSRAKQKFITNGTCPGFNSGNYSTVSGELRRIDHIFVTRPFTVEHYGVLNPSYYSTTGTADYHERAFSDHSPVFAKLSIRNPEMAVLPTTPPLSIDGVYQISTPEDLQAFSFIVGGITGFSQDTAAKAVLTDDIDMESITCWLPIGTEEKPFTGTFDGQGHTIRNISVTTGKSYSGLFGSTSGATIKNFSIDGAFSFKEGTGAGAIGWAESTTVSNVHSSLDIAVPSTAHHIAGVCGSLRSSSKAYNCSFSGTITTDPNTHDCIGGIGGYSNGGCLYENCANYGTITFAKATAYAGGIFGYINNDGFAGVKNCLNVGEVKITSGEAQYSGAIVGRAAAHPVAAFANNYWLEGTAKQAHGQATDINETATAVNAEQLESGEVCYKLNAPSLPAPSSAVTVPPSNWFQTLNVDPYPVLFPTSAEIFYNATEDFYYNVIDGEVGIEEVHDQWSMANDQSIYNLAGQRLSKLQKGLNIVNGRKVLVK